MTKNERIGVIIAVTVAVLLIAWAIWAGALARQVNLACKAAGYDYSHHVFFTREGYCREIEVVTITVPLAQVIREGE